MQENPLGLLTLQEICCQHYPADEQTHPLPAHVRKAARAIMQCRTAALGGHVQGCPEGHFMRIWYNSCRHRSCPQCAYLQVERWLARQQARLLACAHSHVIFTLPHELHALWLTNVEVLSRLLFHAARATWFVLLGDATYLGAQPGVIAALHTWSQTWVLHPHLPCLVTGGGLSPAGQWVAVRNGCLLPARVVMAVFRGKMVAGLRRAWAREERALPEGMRAQQLLNLLNRLGHPRQTRWNVRLMERDAHGRGVVRYLARDLRGGPLPNTRLVNSDAQRSCFTYRARAPEAGPATRPCLSLSPEAFLQRVLLPVPPPTARVVRCYGLYQHSHSAALAACRPQLGQPPVVMPACRDWQSVCAERGEAHPERCPLCGVGLVCTAVIPRGGAPPPLREAGAA
jgi:Putative transposase/Transposase zinc-binding domain